MQHRVQCWAQLPAGRQGNHTLFMVTNKLLVIFLHEETWPLSKFELVYFKHECWLICWLGHTTACDWKRTPIEKKQRTFSPCLIFFGITKFIFIFDLLKLLKQNRTVPLGLNYAGLPGGLGGKPVKIQGYKLPHLCWFYNIVLSSISKSSPYTVNRTFSTPCFAVFWCSF